MQINFDHASHTPTDERVLAEFMRIEHQFPGNPMAAHNLGQAAAIELGRITAQTAQLLNCQPQEIIYTSGASEANNLAIKGIAAAYSHIGRHILTTPLEHPSVSSTLAHLQPLGYEIELLKLLPNGKIDLVHLAKAIRKDTVLVCVSVIDSELGVIQPIAEISEILQDIHLHIDAAQAIGKIILPYVHYSTLCISAHKFGGISGAGLLIKRDGVVLEPMIHGGKGSTMYRAGTPTLSLAGSTLTALEIVQEELPARLQKVQSLNQFLRGKLKNINSPQDATPYILNISTPGIRGTAIQQQLAERGINVSVKSACATDNSPSRAVMAVTGDKTRAQSSWRISLSHHNTMKEIETLLKWVI